MYYGPMYCADNYSLTLNLLPASSNIKEYIYKDAIVGVPGTFFSLFKGFLAIGIFFYLMVSKMVSTWSVL